MNQNEDFYDESKEYKPEKDMIDNVDFESNDYLERASDDNKSNEDIEDIIEETTPKPKLTKKTGYKIFILALIINIVIQIGIGLLLYVMSNKSIIHILSSKLYIIINTMTLYSILLLIIYLVIKSKSEDFRTILRIKPPIKKRAFIYSSFIPIGIFITIIAIAILLFKAADRFGYDLTMLIGQFSSIDNINGFEQIFIADNLMEYFFLIFTLAFIPAIIEELYFRGLMFSSFNNSYKKSTTLVLTSLFFGIMHIDPFRIFPTFILGLILAYVMIKSESIYISIWVHFLNNSIAITLASGLVALLKYHVSIGNYIFKFPVYVYSLIFLGGIGLFILGFLKIKSIGKWKKSSNSITDIESI